MIYYFLLMLILVNALLPTFNRQLAFSFSILLLLSLAVFVGINYGVGQDYESYKSIYNSIKPIDAYGDFGTLIKDFSYIHGEFGFLIILSFLKGVGAGFNFFIFLNSFLSFLLLFISIAYFSKNPSLSILIYVLFFFLLLQFVQIRMGLVFSIFCILIIVAFYKRNILFLTILVLTLLYHKIAIIAFGLIFLSRIYRPLNPYFFLVISWVVFQLKPLSLTMRFLLGGAFDLDTLVHYSNDNVYTNTKFPIYTYSYFVGMYFIFYFYAMKHKDDHRYIYLVNLFLLSLILWVVFWEVVIFGSRFFLLYAASLIYLIPATYGFIKGFGWRALFTFYWFSYFFLYFVRNIHAENLGFLPYKTILGI